MSSAKNSTAIILAAGMGVRMKSKKPKILHAAAGRPLIDHVITGLKGAGLEEIRVVVGHGGDQVRNHLQNRPSLRFFTQEKQLGTADAVKSADIPSLKGTVLICNGDHPLITAGDYKAALDTFAATGTDLMVITATVKNPTGFGRIQRDSRGNLISIIEEKDADAQQKKIREVNSGLYVAKAEILKKFLPQIGNDNAKGEYYLTDIIKIALKAGAKVRTFLSSPRVCRGVNNQMELALATRSLYRRKALELLEAGVAIIDPATTYIESDVTVGSDTVIYPGCLISGPTVIGSGCVIESHCQIRSSRIGNGVEVRWGTLIDQSEVADGALVGPYARLRPESVIGEGAHIGNFVETKKAVIGPRAKANHLTYLGDAEIGEETNIGCGTITCNYAVDRKKYKTKIGKRVFVGSDSQFVAPVTVGDDAVIASGSTITKDVPERALGLARSQQIIKPDYIKEK